MMKLFPVLSFLLLPALLSVPPAQAAETDGAFVEALRGISRPLDGESMDTVVARLAEGRLALLGEASHGTSEYYRLRGEFSLRLIREHGFRFVAVEGDWNAIQKLHRYVIGLENPEGGAREIMGSFQRWPQWMWANEEFASFVEELREWNLERDRAQRAGLYGIDLYGMEDALRELPLALESVDPALATEIRERLSCFAPYMRNLAEYARAAAGMAPLSPCAGATDAALRILRERDADLPTVERFHLLQMARVIQSGERHYRSMGWGGPASWNHRARHFYDTAHHLLEEYGPESRGIIWAHNTHVGDARATDMARGRQFNIGQLAREELGLENVVILGFGTREGTLLAGRSWGGPCERMTKPPAPEGTAEHKKHLAGPGDLVFFFDDSPDILSRILGHRAAGVIYHPEREFPGNYVPTSLRERYNLFIFLETTTALDPLGPTVLP